MEQGRTIVLRKADQWYIFNSQDGDERQILIALLNLSEQELDKFEGEDVFKMVESLGWRLEVYQNLERAG